jgi:hypothetical protein
MKYLMMFLLSLSLNSFAFEGGVCSQQTTLCANISSEVDFTTTSEGRFLLKLKATEGGDIQLNKVDLWMQMGHHGHGSSPLKVTLVSPLEYDITKAYFVMKGLWQVRVSYTQDGVSERLIIPVMIHE